MKKIIEIIFGVMIFLVFINNANAISKTINVDIVETRDLIVTFAPIDQKTSTFIDTVKNNSKFLNLTYPLADNGLIIEINDEVFDTSPIIGDTLENDERFLLLKNLFKNRRVSGKTDRVVGITPKDWFTNRGLGNTKGFTALRKRSPWGLDLIYTPKSVVVEEGFRHGASHELGHTFGLCDEYDNDVWLDQNNFLNGCPNGDSDNNGLLDPQCLDEVLGCDTSTFGELIPYLTTEGEIDLFNFMGVSNNDTLRWVNNDSYEHLLDQFSSPFSFITVDFGILISGMIDKNGTTEFDNAYILDEQSILNESGTGNFSIILESNETIFYNLSFEPNFKIIDINGNVIETNITYFAFVVPYSDNVTRILVKENETVIRSEKNVTPNPPVVNITYPTGGELFDNPFNITWDATDLDNDTINYAVLLSSDNGTTFSTLEIDYPNTTLTINSSNFVNSHEYKIKILATDGINTGNDTTETFTISNPVPPTVTLVSPENNNVSATASITFNCSGDDFNENLENITLYHNISGIWTANETKAITGITDYKTFTINNIPNGNYIWNCLAYDNTSLSGWGDANWTITINVISPQDTWKFHIRNSTGTNMAWFGNFGNLVLKGTLTQNTTLTPTANDEFRFRANNEDVMLIDTTNGNMYIKGFLYENQNTLTPSAQSDDFIIKNASSDVVAYVNESGYIFLKGNLYENSNP